MKIIVRKVHLLAVLVGVAVLALTPSVWAAATLVSDKDDYIPSEVAVLTGAGFQPGEPIDLTISIDDPVSAEHIAEYDWMEFYADGSGGFVVEYIVPSEAADMALTATAMGLESSLIATAMFTDTVSSAKLTSPTHGTPTTITSLPATVKVSFTHSSSGTEGTTAEVSVPGVGSFGPQTVPTGGTAALPLSASMDILIPSGTPNGMYNVQLTIKNNTNPGPKTDNDNQNGALIINVAPPPTNQSPVISCLDPMPPADLRSIVGLLSGSSFSATVPVSYTTVTEANGSVTVRATFDLGATGPSDEDVTVVMATVTDPNGNNTLTAVTLSDGTSPVELIGPGPASAEFSVKVKASDGIATVGPTDCNGTATAKVVYDFVGFLEPLADTTAQTVRLVKRGSTVPTKFRLYDAEGTEIYTDLGAGVHSIAVYFHSGAVPSGPEPTDSGASNDNGTSFRYGGTPEVDGNWIFNLQTKTDYKVGYTYKIEASLNDGTQHYAYIGIK